MAAARAHQLCPDGVFLPVDGAYYRQVSRQIFTDIFSQVTDAIEQVSVDECYMDVSGALLRWGSPTRIGAWLREQVSERFHITCSVGVACNKLVAKMASTNAKPNGMLLIPASQHDAFVQMMPLRAIPGIGPALERRLHTWGVESVQQLAAPGYANKCPSDSTSPARWAWHATNSWRKWPPRTPNRTACCSSQQANTTLLCR